MKNLYKKMHAVMCETQSLERDKEVGYGRNAYKAISEAAVLNEIKPLFKKHGLIIFPCEIQVNDRVDTFLTKDGESSRLMTQVIHKWKIVDTETGEFEIVASVGNGVDTQDKSSGKAQTYSLKAVLQKTFMMFSGDDSDNDFSEEITKQQTKRSEPKPPTDKALSSVLEKIEYLNEPDLQAGILKAYKKSALNEFTTEELSKLSSQLDVKIDRMEAGK